MKVEEYLKLGQKYLTAQAISISAAVKVSKEIEKKASVVKRRVFKKWENDVNKHQSHSRTANTDEYHLKRLKAWLSPKKA